MSDHVASYCCLECATGRPEACIRATTLSLKRPPCRVSSITTGSPLDEIERLELRITELQRRVHELEDYIVAARAVLAKVLAT